MSEPYLDPYAVLGLPRSASAEAIKQAYFALVRANPPEREPAAFKRIRAAYERLKDPQQRVENDLLLLQPWPEPQRRRRPPAPVLRVGRADVLALLRAQSDLDRDDWREQFEKVAL